MKIVKILAHRDKEGRGFNPKNLSILVVHDENGQGHAVLAVRLYKNNKPYILILDNKVKSIIGLDEMKKKYKLLFVSKTELVRNEERGNYQLRFFFYKKPSKQNN